MLSLEKMYRDYISSCSIYKDRFSLPSSVHEFPFIKFDDAIWCPKKIDVLFIAESPPFENPAHYFYNATQNFRFGHGLSRTLFQLLNIPLNSDKKRLLQEFKDRGYFVVDTIKIPYKNSKTLPQSVLKMAAHHLFNEITLLEPRIIISFGRYALNALKMHPTFQKLIIPKSNITTLHGHVIDFRKINLKTSTLPQSLEGVIISAYPTPRLRLDLKKPFISMKEIFNVK